MKTRREGTPWATSDHAAVRVRRLCVQALNLPEWPPAALDDIAARVLSASEPPRGSEGVLFALREATRGVGDLRKQLLGAVAYPGWKKEVLAEIGAALTAAAPNSRAPEIVALREALRELGV
jgi:hypothetical protein